MSLTYSGLFVMITFAFHATSVMRLKFAFLVGDFPGVIESV